LHTSPSSNCPESPAPESIKGRVVGGSPFGNV
jgi:hypothetical protein